MPHRPFRAWLFAIVRNRAIDMLRRQRAHSRIFSAGLDDPDTLAMCSAGDDEQQIRDASAGSVLAALNPQQREALTLTKLLGFSITEAADRLGISRTAMKVRVHRATLAAAKALEGDRE